MKKKFLVFIDESKELEKAIHFAAKRAKNTDGTLSMLYVVDHAMNAQWSKVENLIEQEETSEAKKICRSWAQKIKEKYAIETEIILKLGNRLNELVKLLKEDEDIRLNSYKDGVAEVMLKGACAGCPSSTVTLKHGVERMIKHYVPEVNSVEAVNIDE